MSFTYYLYISDSKVDLLWDQIEPGTAGRRATEWSAALPGVGLRRSVENAGPVRTARLERVLRYLDKYGDMGTVDDPGQFFRGMLPMQWGPVTTSSGRGLVYFGGRTDRVIVGLGGSSRHVIGAAAAADEERQLAGSQLPRLLDGLAPEQTRPKAAVADDPLEQLDHQDRLALELVHQANAQLRGPAQNLEFVAKRLLVGPSPYPDRDGRDDMTVLLGSPLYVAQID